MKTDIFQTNKKYDILYTDPPWIQGRGGRNPPDQILPGWMSHTHHGVPEIIQVQNWHVCHNLMNEKHNVFMWTIDKYLPDAERIMATLGYRLHARIIWDKVNGPAPAYTLRFSHEYLLWFYERGNIILPEKDKRGAFTTVMREPSRKHSQKPECAYRMIESLFPKAEKLELFARTERAGWDAWGNEI